MRSKVHILQKTVLLTLAGSFIFAMYSGIRNNYGIMLSAIVDNSGISFASVSFILAVGQLIFGLVQPAFGMLAAKKGATYAFFSGVILTITGMMLTPLCTSIGTLMLCLGILLPAGCGAISYGIIMGNITPKLPLSAVPTASGIVNASSGIGNTLLSPVISSLISAGGLMYTMRVLTIPIFLTLPVALFMGRAKKAQGEEIAKSAPPPVESTVQAPIKEVMKNALKSRNYVYLMAGFFTCGFHMALITNHLPTQIQSFGFSAETTSYAFSIYGITTVIGSVLSGSLCGKLKMKNVLAFFYGLRPITIFLFLIIPKTLLTVTLFTALFGFSGAATVPPVSGMISKTFGAQNLAMLFGLVFFVHQIGGFFGAWLGGVCFSQLGGYTVIWCASLIFSIAASFVSYIIRSNAEPEHL